MKDNRSIIITILVIVGIIAIILILTSRLGFNSTPRDSIQVSGQSSLEVTPDLITIYYNVETKAKTSKEAEDANSLIVENLKDAIVSYGFSEDEVEKYYAL